MLSRSAHAHLPKNHGHVDFLFSDGLSENARQHTSSAIFTDVELFPSSALLRPRVLGAYGSIRPFAVEASPRIWQAREAKP